MTCSTCGNPVSPEAHQCPYCGAPVMPEPASPVHVVFLKEGQPPVRVAMLCLEDAVANARAWGARYLKVVHGYGSTGAGGALYRAVRERLEGWKGMKEIRDFIPGEQLKPPRVSRKRYAELMEDPDFGRANWGITIIVL